MSFRFSFICSLLLDVDHYSGIDYDGMFPLFYKQVARNLAPKFEVIFRHLVTGCSFPASWRLVDVVSVLKGSAYSDIEDHTVSR